MSLWTSQKAVADLVGSNPLWLAQPAASARLCFGTVLASQHGAVFWNGNQQDRAIVNLIFERLWDHMEMRFSPLIFILSDLCENVLHKKNWQRTSLVSMGRLTLPVENVTMIESNGIAKPANKPVHKSSSTLEERPSTLKKGRRKNSTIHRFQTVHFGIPRTSSSPVLTNINLT